MGNSIVIYLIVSLIVFFIGRKAFIRLQLSKAKHRSISGHSKWSRRIAALVPYFEYDQEHFFACDGAPNDIVDKRKQGVHDLDKINNSQNNRSTQFVESLEDSISDVQFTTAYRVPFPFRKQLSKALRLGTIVEETKGVQIKDIDNNWRYDLSGSYGVNVFGYDFYKSCMDEGFKKVSQLGPVLGAYHPLIRENVEKLKQVSRLDEVSFHMSGTEAVMQAVRLARYHTGKTHLVRFCGAYHGWWDGVQPGIGNQRKTNDVYTLSDLSEVTIKVLNTRKDIACILINPLQAMHPNSDAPGDVKLIASDRSANFDKATYKNWLKRLREICTERNIVLIFDEVFTGFRLAYRGAQEYFDVQADMVTYGKTLGGGLPVGVLCGKHELMKRYKDNSPANVSFARGTFNSHPYVMASMNEFLKRIEEPHYQTIYQQADALWNQRVLELNQQLNSAKLPIRVVNMHSILTVLYQLPSCYNWMFQFYLKSEGLDISWVGSGRFIMSLNFTDEDFVEVSLRFIKAAKKMQQDGWWWQAPGMTNKAIKRQFLKEMLVARYPVLQKVVKSNNHSNLNQSSELREV